MDIEFHLLMKKTWQNLKGKEGKCLLNLNHNEFSMYNSFRHTKFRWVLNETSIMNSTVNEKNKEFKRKDWECLLNLNHIGVNPCKSDYEYREKKLETWNPCKSRETW
jgi:hypothetical protein